MNKNNISGILTGISAFILMSIGLWGGEFIIIALSIISFVGSYLLFKNKKIGKWICLTSICLQLFVMVSLVVEVFKENSVNSYESYMWYASLYFIGVPILYLIITLLFIIRSKPTHILK